MHSLGEKWSVAFGVLRLYTIYFARHFGEILGVGDRPLHPPSNPLISRDLYMATVRTMQLVASTGPMLTTLMVKLDGIRVGENGIEGRWLASKCPQPSIPLCICA